MARQLAYLASHAGLTFLSYRAARGLPALPGARLPHLPLLLLLLLTSFGFAGELTRLLASRVAHIPPPRLSRGLLLTLAFWLSLSLTAATAGSVPLYAGLAALVAAAALDALRFFVRATRAVAGAVGLHPFRVRGARHWYSLT